MSEIADAAHISVHRITLTRLDNGAIRILADATAMTDGGVSPAVVEYFAETDDIAADQVAVLLEILITGDADG